MKAIYTNHAPEPVGPYAQAVAAGDFVFCSGQIALDPNTNTLVSGGVVAQTKQVFANLVAVLKAADCKLSDVVKVDIFVANMDDFREVNDAYATLMGGNKPARATVEVSRLPKDALIEVSCVVYKPAQ